MVSYRSKAVVFSYDVLSYLLKDFETLLLVLMNLTSHFCELLVLPSFLIALTGLFSCDLSSSPFEFSSSKRDEQSAFGGVKFSKSVSAD